MLAPRVLQGLRPPPGGGQPTPPPVETPNPYQGNPNPGEYAQPAPFNPLLAQILMGQQGGMGRGASTAGLRGPMSGFGAGTPGPQRPRNQRPNPYQTMGR